MIKIYVDTNILLDFYRKAHPPGALVDDLTKQVGHLVTTDQTINEFLRNRANVLNQLIRNFKTSTDVVLHTASVLMTLDDHGAFRAAHEVIKTKAEAILSRLNSMRDDLENDPAGQKIVSLLRHNDIQTIHISGILIQKAHERKLLGNPPSSPDKHTLGDEVIWEALISDHNNDLIIVTRDDTYHNNKAILTEEYNKSGRNLVLVTNSITDALKKVGETPSVELIEEEKAVYTGSGGGQIGPVTAVGTGY
jgi:predicted nucleic acid-binding protein